METLEECFVTERNVLTEKAETFGNFLETFGYSSAASLSAMDRRLAMSVVRAEASAFAIH